MEEAGELEANGKPKTITIVVNGTPHDVPKKDELTYDEIVTYAYPDYPQNPGGTYSVTFTRGEKPKEGILAPGTWVKAKNGMVFRVNRTSQS